MLRKWEHNVLNVVWFFQIYELRTFIRSLHQSANIYETNILLSANVLKNSKAICFSRAEFFKNHNKNYNWIIEQFMEFAIMIELKRNVNKVSGT